MHLHEFLGNLHRIVNPDIYLEIGVQNGTSLDLAHAAHLAIGVDPAPRVTEHDNQKIFPCTSDTFFTVEQDIVVDLGFIDGLHHFEQALRDFTNIENYCTRRSIIVFDDVLPRNQFEAQREQCPGDWTGDVWKVSEILARERPELTLLLVNTQPTGTLLVWNFASKMKPRRAQFRTDAWMHVTEVPDSFINRSYAVEPEYALSRVNAFRQLVDGGPHE